MELASQLSTHNGDFIVDRNKLDTVHPADGIQPTEYVFGNADSASSDENCYFPS